MNFTSIEPSRPPVTQPCQGAATHPSQAAFTLTQPSQPSFTQLKGTCALGQFL